MFQWIKALTPKPKPETSQMLEGENSPCMSSDIHCELRCTQTPFFKFSVSQLICEVLSVTPWQSPASFNRNSCIRRPFQCPIERQCRNVLFIRKTSLKMIARSRPAERRCHSDVQVSGLHNVCTRAAEARASWVNWTTGLPGFPSVEVHLPTSYLWTHLYTKYTKDSSVISQSYTNQDTCCSNFAVWGIDWILIVCGNSVS